MNPIEKALVLKEELDSLRPLSKEQEMRIMQKFRLDWNYHSNHLEGNSLTYGETKALLLFGITAQGKPLKDHLEIEGHNEAIEWVMERVKGEYPLTESFIRELHQLLLKESYWVEAITSEGRPTKKKVEVGKYKSSPNHVQTSTGEIFYFATPEETPAQMDDLMKWYREKTTSDEVNAVLLAAEFHYRFIRIHPFDDGNGRTARILMNFILMKDGFPPVVIKTEDKSNYLSALRQADAGIIEPFINYIATNLIRSMGLMIRGAKGESIEEPDDFDKELALLERRLKQGNQEVEKTVEVVQELYHQSIVPLFQKFVEEGKKFERFYTGSKVTFELLNTAGASSSTTFVKYNFSSLPVDKNAIIADTAQFRMCYSYETFNHVEYGSFSFYTEIYIMLGSNTYVVKRNSENKLEKKYDEQLTDEEIRELVREKMKWHKEFLEMKMANK
ncbi:Fic family protein [Telluribacter sp. SYSU D00476]|uniref:Fic family protein n=1 Tax=Telluribacter sp. SYSU D00476 TaxID=2811430 RepID=UPI001FF26C67|nr:Fic family protein [Telluribacter sp. SYSU D00476]